MNLFPALRQALALLFMIGSLGWMVAPAHSATLDISENPLFLTANVPPNVTVTLDDSGSMSRAFTPDICGNPNGICDSNPDASLNHRYVKSSYYNPIYYNPAVTYTAPVDASGAALSTSFNKAWINGYAPSLSLNGESYYDLAKQYRPTAGLFLHSSAKRHEFMNHYTATSDLTTQSYTTHTHTAIMSGSNGGSNAPYFTITDFSDIDGSQAGSDPGANLISVTVAGTAAKFVGTFSGTCDNDKDPANDYEYKTSISGGTLTLCFRDSNAMYGKTVVLQHKNGLTTGTMPAGQKDPTGAYYYVFDETNVGCTGEAAQKKVDNDCYDLKIVGPTSGPSGTDERQNFANWYSFYRTRNLATIASTSLAFAEFDASTRVSWQSLNTCRGSASTLVTTDCEGWETTSPNFSNTIKPFAGSHRQNFYTWLFRLNTNTSTPLREAMIRVGEYYKTTGENSPYDDDLLTAGTVSGTSGQLSCRKNFHILMTDGIWSDSTLSGINNQDGALAPPYKDANSSSLADVAYKYWATDLTALANNLLPYIVESGDEPAQSNNAKNDPATWQHMVNFTVGLGLTPFLDSVGLKYAGSTYTGSFLSIAGGTTPWPSIASDGGKVADLWHAAINSRGQFFSAETPDSLVNAFKAVKNAIEVSTPSAAALAANSTSIQTGAMVYQATFNSKDWSGDLVAYAVQFGGVVDVGNWEWKASEKLPAASDRKIYTLAGGNKVEFTWSALPDGGDEQTYLNTNASGDPDTNGADRLDWLRGVQAQEIVTENGVVKSGIFRPRKNVLADIINSDPAFAHADDFGYANMGAPEASSYAGYVSGKVSGDTKRTPAVFVGSNGGMLHAFQADAGKTGSGRELFAYVPNGVYQHLSKLTDPGYVHKYYVDGGPTVGDAYLSSGWATVLVGGLGGGGRSIYALNVSDVANPSASMVMWEYTETDLGLTYSKPQIARLNNGQWAAIFGNGYNSTNQRAYLYVVNLQTGALIAKIEAGSQPSNGLSTPTIHDADGDMIADYAYAGDLQGNLWKFDLKSFADQATPLFVARNALEQVQPITAQPTLGGHPNGGVLVYFGTGQYLESTDPLDPKVQSFYAIWDNGSPVTTTDRSELQGQSITKQLEKTFTVSDNGTPTDPSDDKTQTSALRVTSANSVDWSVKRGWYMDLNEPSSGGERVVTQALLRYGRVIFLTVIPSTDSCDAGGESWLMELDAVTGAQTTDSSFDFNNDGKFDSADLIEGDGAASGVKTTVGITKPPAWFTGSDGKDFKVMTGTTGGIQSLGNKGGGGGGNPVTGGSLRRTYWRQIQ